MSSLSENQDGADSEFTFTPMPEYLSAKNSLSARHSIRRARMLFARTPVTAFIPDVDPKIRQNSINRRKRRIISKQIDNHPKSKNNKSSLAIIAASDGSANNGSAISMEPLASAALAIRNEDTKKSKSRQKILEDDNPGGGILVVCCDASLGVSPIFVFGALPISNLFFIHFLDFYRNPTKLPIDSRFQHLRGMLLGNFQQFYRRIW